MEIVNIRTITFHANFQLKYSFQTESQKPVITLGHNRLRTKDSDKIDTFPTCTDNTHLPHPSRRKRLKHEHTKLKPAPNGPGNNRN